MELSTSQKEIDMGINLFDVLEEMHTMTRSCYEDYPDGSRGIKMPTLDDRDLDDEADEAYEQWKAKDVNKEES